MIGVAYSREQLALQPSHLIARAELIPKTLKIHRADPSYARGEANTRK